MASGTEQPTSPQASDTLDPVLELRINKHITKLVSGWMTFIGVANLAALVAAMAYIFFVLPEHAIEKAGDVISQKSITTTDKINEQLGVILKTFGQIQQQSDTLNADSKRIKDRNETLAKEAEALAERSALLEKQTGVIEKQQRDVLERVNTIKRLDLTSVSEIAKLVQGSEETARILRVVNSVDPLFDQMNKQLSEFTTETGRQTQIADSLSKRIDALEAGLAKSASRESFVELATRVSTLDGRTSEILRESAEAKEAIKAIRSSFVAIGDNCLKLDSIQICVATVKADSISDDRMHRSFAVTFDAGFAVEPTVAVSSRGQAGTEISAPVVDSRWDAGFQSLTGTLFVYASGFAEATAPVVVTAVAVGKPEQ